MRADDAVRAAQVLLEKEIRDRQATIFIPESLPYVIADPTLLQIVFLNLLSNALKFVAPEVRPVIEITARIHANRVTVYVTDNGLGIPAEAREQIFRIFERFHPEHPGTGIGLAIVHRAIERLEGRIGVETPPSGTGTRFWIELPAG